MAKVIYGYLYNYFAAVDSRLPNGNDYRLPTNAEMRTDLVAYVGTTYNVAPDDFGIGNHLKSRRQDGSPLGGVYDTDIHPYWRTDATEYGRDTVNFGFIGGSYRLATGGYLAGDAYLPQSIGRLWHVSSHWQTADGEGVLTYHNVSTIGNSRVSRPYGSAVRLCRDATVSEQALDDGTILTDDYTGNDGKKYDGVKINDLIWLATNLAETKFDDDTDIPNVTADADWAALVDSEDTSLGDPGRCAYDNDESFAVEETGVEVGASATINILAEGAAEGGDTGIEVGAEATISIVSESGQTKSVDSGSSATINILSEASSSKGVDKDSESIINILSEADKVKGVSLSASATISILSQGTKVKSTDVGSSATISILSEGAATKGADKDSESTINILSEANKIKGVSVGSSSIITIQSEANKIKSVSIGVESSIDIVAEGVATAETPPIQKGAEATINVLAEASGTKITGVSSEALVEIIAEALGEKSVNKEEQALLDIFSEADKTKGTTKGSDSTILISAEARVKEESFSARGFHIFLIMAAQQQASV